MGKQGHGDCVYLAAGQLPRINGLLKVLVHGSVLRKLRRLAAAAGVFSVDGLLRRCADDASRLRTAHTVTRGGGE